MGFYIELFTSFDFYYDVKFWVVFVFIICAFRMFSHNVMLKNTSLFLFSVLMLLALPNFTLPIFIFLFCICVLVFLTGKYLNGNSLEKAKLRLGIAILSITSIILLLSFFKYSLIQNYILKTVLNNKTNVSGYFFIIGISYLSFKLMHFIIECYKKKITDLKFIHFLNYIFFFCPFISGPINRYNHFCAQLDIVRKKNIKSDFKEGAERIIHGLFKKMVMCTIIFPYTFLNIKTPIIDLDASIIILGLYAYTLYFYFDFSGYSDIAIGSARLMGFELPENFNNPFFKKNIQQLWANWHMSLTGWLTDYIYWPLSKRLRNFAYFRTRPILLSNISIIVTFIVCGMWHGDTMNFILWGSYHGIGLATLNIYQKQKRSIRNETIKDYFRSKYSYWIGVFGTFHFFVFGLIFFTLDMKVITQLFIRIF
jgi:alginate O-acetyltransferase complex protein AlgI